MRTGWRTTTDLALGVLRARGADTISFLQGQLSNDASELQPGQLQLSGYHTPQGRAIALLRLIPLAIDDVLAVLPQELVPVVVTRLKRFVLRAKVQLTDDSAQWQLTGYQGHVPAVPAGTLAAPYGLSRHLALTPRTAGGEAAGGEAADGSREDWIACDIGEGLPQVYVATSEAFVAQMLNLDLTSGIALDKGCYTGQEIIARAHYRGQVKRRMQRFVSEVPCTLVPGQTGTLNDGRGFKVVEAISRADGCCEFLAVANPTPAVGHVADVEAHTEAETQVIVAARSLPLPYELPPLRV